MTEIEQLRAEISDLKAKLGVDAPPTDYRIVGEKAIVVPAGCAPPGTEPMVEFLERRKAIWQAKTGNELRHVVERQWNGTTHLGHPQYSQLRIMEDGGSTDGQHHREPDSDESVRLRWQLRFWTAREADVRRLLEEAYTLARNTGNSSPAQLAAFERGRHDVAEATSNIAAIKERLRAIDPRIAAFEHQQANPRPAPTEMVYGVASPVEMELRRVYTAPLPTVEPTVQIGGQP